MDFRKVYDLVRWSFVDQVLEKMGFGSIWRKWIMSCFESTSVSILINGSPSKPFKMERGLRQGNPLSHFLFILIMEVLNKLLDRAKDNGAIEPMIVGTNKVELLHL